MRALVAWASGLPAWIRWTGAGVGAVLIVAVAALGYWTWSQRREVAAQTAFGPVATAAEQALEANQAASLEAAASTLNQFLKDHGRSRTAAQAWYLLGTTEAHRGQSDLAEKAYLEASRQDSGTVGALARLGLGQVLEAKGDATRAVQVYGEALAGRSAKEFLVGDLLLAKGRAQEMAKDTAGAIASYQRFLKEHETSPRSEGVRIRLALLGAAGG